MFQPEYDFHCKSDCTQSSVSSYMSAVYPTSYPVATAGYPGVYCDFGLYPYPVAYGRAYDDDDYYVYDRRYTAAAAAAAATQRLRSYYGGGASSRSAYELSPSPPSPGVATGHQQAKVPSSCRLVTSSENADNLASYISDDLRLAETSTAEVARSHAFVGYTGHENFPPPSHTVAPNVQQRRGNSSPTAPRASPSSSLSSCTESGLHRATAAVSSPTVAADCAPVNLAGTSNRWAERRTVIMGEIETSGGGGGGHHQSVICRTRHDPSSTVADSSQQRVTTSAVRLYESADDIRRQTSVTSTIHDSKVYEYHRRLKAAATASQPAADIYSSRYCASQLDHTATSGSSPTDDDDDVEENCTTILRQQLPAAAGARPYFRVGCTAAGQQQQRRLQHHVPTGNHVTGYTSVIVDTQQLHANGYVH